MGNDEDNSKLQKSKSALERKRAADRISRRKERARTKEYIASLEERIQLLLQRDDNSELTQKLLAENRQLSERLYAYQKIVGSARATLEDIPEASTSSAAQHDAITTGPCVVSGSNVQHSGPQAPESGLIGCHQILDADVHVNDSPYLGHLISPFTGQPITGIPASLLNTGPRTLHMIQHPSPLDKTSVYRFSSNIPNFHQGHCQLEDDESLGHTLEDVMAGEKLDCFFGKLLPILSPSLQSLYAGVQEHLSYLNPASVLADLLPGSHHMECNSDTASAQDTANIVSLLKMSIAKYIAVTIREAQANLRPENRRSPAEIVAVFWIAYKLLIWMSFPTINNYAQIPPWYRPTQAQLSIHHPSYIDALVFPLLRDKLVYTHNTYETTKLLEDVNSFFTFVWQPRVCVMNQDTPLIFMSPANAWEFELESQFKSAIWDLRSWRMTPEFVALYPELKDCVYA